jgi:hypothetical protein
MDLSPKNTESRKSDCVTKRELERIRNLNGVIKIYQTELELLKYKSCLKGTVITGMPFGTDTTDSTADIAVAKVAQMKKYERMIRDTLDEIQTARIEIMTYISTVEDNVLKQIMYYWNVCCMTWYEVANSVGKSEYIVKKKYYRHFKRGEK